jgi:drug/metabolite transporter (DMT)-like permease
MSSQTVYQLVIGVAVLALLIYRQVQRRPVTQARQRVGLILGVIGLVLAVQYLQKHSGTVVIAALIGSLVLAAGFGAARAATVRLWMQSGQPWSQGNWLTVLLWVIAVAAHLGLDALLGSHKGLSGLGSATLVLYLAVSLIVQFLIVNYRAQRLSADVGAESGSLV